MPARSWPAASRYALGAGGVGAAHPAHAASPISASRYALGARRTALRAEGAARRGRCAPVCLTAPGGAAAGCHRRRARSARRRWRGRCAPGRLHVLPPDNARVASWWWGGRRRRALGLRRSRRLVQGALRAPAEGEGGEGCLRHHHARACGATLACYRSMCSASRRGVCLCNRSALPPGQAAPPHFERARAAARRWRGAS